MILSQLNAVVFVKLLVLLLLLVLLKLVLFSIVIQCSLVKLLDVHEHDETESSSIIIQSIVWVFLMGNSINSIESIAFLSLLSSYSFFSWFSSVLFNFILILKPFNTNWKFTSYMKAVIIWKQIVSFQKIWFIHTS